MRRPLSGRTLLVASSTTGTSRPSLAREAVTARAPVIVPSRAPFETHHTPDGTPDGLELAIENLKSQIEKISSMIAEGKV